MNKLVLLVFFSALSFIACKKQTVQEPERIKPHKFVYIDTNTSQLLVYKPGSYWIVRDSISSQTDSFFVSQNYNSIENNPEGILVNDTNYIYETITTMIESKNGNNLHLSCTNFPDNIKSPENIIWLCVKNAFCGLGLNTKYQPFTKYGQSITNSYLADSVIVNGTWYKNVEVNYFKNLGANQIDFATGYTYWQKNKGLLKYYCNYNNTTTCYEMIRRNIVQ